MSKLILPRVPAKKRGVLEYRHEQQRQAVIDALSQLWDAMELSSGGGLGEPWEERYAAYRFIGTMIVGEDCPDKDVNC